MAKQDEFAKFQVRIPMRLRKALEASCEETGRSLNAELIWRLERSFNPLDKFVVEMRGANSDPVRVAKLVESMLPMQRHGVESIVLRMIDTKVLDRLGIGLDDPTPLPPELD